MSPPRDVRWLAVGRRVAATVLGVSGGAAASGLCLVAVAHTLHFAVYLTTAMTDKGKEGLLALCIVGAVIGGLISGIHISEMQEDK